MRWMWAPLAALMLTGCQTGPQVVLAERPTATRASADAIARGREVFLTGPCVTCHTVRGTTARGRVGPDLTHIASRATLAGGIIPNTRGYLAGWILNSQRIKPGSLMPPVQLATGDLHDLLAFLESLE